MRKLTCLLLALVMVFGLAAFGLASVSNTRAASYPDPDYVRDNEQDLVYCTEKFAYEQGVDFYKMWWIANNEKDYFRQLDFSYCPPYYSAVLENRRNSTYMNAINQWRIMTFQMDDWGPGHTNNTIKAFTEGMLFNLLYDANSDSAAVNLSSNYTSAVGEWAKNIQNFGVSAWEAVTRAGAEFNKLTPLGPAFMENQHDALILEGLSKEFEFFSDVSKLFGYAETVGEYIDGIARLSEMVGTNQALEEILLGMKRQMSSANTNHGYDSAYSSSLQNFSSYFSDYMTEELAIALFTSEKTAREAYSEGIEVAKDAAAKKWLGVGIADAVVQATRFAADLFTGLDDEYNAFNELEVYYDMEQLLRMEIGSIIDDVNRGNLDAADNFRTAFALLKNMYNIGLDSYENYVDKLYRTGILNNFWFIGDMQHEKYERKVSDAESMRESMNQLFYRAEVGANNAYYEAVQKYNPELIEDATKKEVPSTFQPEDEAKDNFEMLQPTFGMDLKKDLTLTRDLEIYGCIHLESGKLNLNGHKLTVYGNVYIDGGEVVCRGILDVRGSVFQNGSTTFTLPGGCTLTVGQNYEIEPKNGTTRLDIAGGKLTIGGDLITKDRFYSSDSVRISVTDSGELVIGGRLNTSDCTNSDFNSGSLSVGSQILAAGSLSANDSFNVKMTGTGDVRVQNLSGGKLTIENAADRNITFANTVAVASLGGGDMTVTPENLSFGAQALQNDVTFSGGVTVTGKTDLNGHTMTVNGDIVTQNDVNVNGTLTVTGNYTQEYNDVTVPADGVLTIGGSAVLKPAGGTTELAVKGGKLTIAGSITSTEKIYSDSYARLSTTAGGTIEIGGAINFLTGTSTNLVGGTLRVSDSLVGEQTLSANSTSQITIGGTGDVRVENLSGGKLTIENAADRKITFANTVAVASLSGGDMTVTPENLSFGAEALENDVTFSGGLTVTGKTDLNGHTMTVNGDVVTQNDVNVNGTFAVTGNYTQEYNDVTVPADGVLTIGGSAVLKPAGGTTELAVKGGKLTVAGSITSTEKIYSDSYARLSTTAGGTIEIGGAINFLTGTSTNLVGGTLLVLDSLVGEQTLSANSTSQITIGGTGDVRVENLSGGKLTIENAADRKITFANTVAVASLDGGDMTVTPENLTFSGALDSELTINGDVTFDNGVVYLKNHTLTVNGSVRQPYNRLYTDSGSLVITGDYLLAAQDSTGADAQGTGSLYMQNKDAVVSVGGKMVVWTSDTPVLTDGVLHLKSHFTQKGTQKLVASGNHLTVLDGTKLQRITFENTDSKFNKLLTTQYDEMYIFNPDNCWVEKKYNCAHEYTETRDAVAATCTEDGYSGDVYCALCGELLEQGHVIETDGHHIITVAPAAASCTEPGHTYGRYCDVCGIVFVQQTEIPATGHDWGDWTVTKQPGPGVEGVETRVCKHDSSHVETRAIPALKAGWVKDNGKWYYYKDNGDLATGWTKVSGTWYYMNSSGVMQTGWQKINAKWYYFSGNGAMKTGWASIGGKWYYFQSSGAMVTGLQTIGGKQYYFDANGAMQTGWQDVGGKRYYFQSSGAAKVGWVQSGGKWYYMDKTGAMMTGWVQVNGVWYYMDASGVMQTGWKKLDSKWYYLDEAGHRMSGWVYLEPEKYYMDENGVMQTGWVEIDGKMYYFNSSGKMVTGWQKIDSKWYFFDADGAMRTGWLKSGGKWYFMDEDTGRMHTGWLERKGKWYYFNGSGVMVTGEQVINGKTRTFDENGVWLGD